MHNESSRSSDSSSSRGGRSSSSNSGRRRSSGCRQLGLLWGVLVVFPLQQQLLLLQQQGTRSAALNLLLVPLLLVQVWDKDYYEEKAKEKASLLGVESLLELLLKPREEPKPPPLPPCGYRKQLQVLTFKLGFEREASRTKMVTLQSPRMQLWCDICEWLCKDSQAYLDHISRRNHNQLLGGYSFVAGSAADGGNWVGTPHPKTKADARVKQQQQQQQGGGAQGTSRRFKALAGGAGAEGRAAEAKDEFERVKRLPEEL
ncbi:U1 like C2H2 zinc finger, related, related [Eimeria acervulina]|uniref:U1 like C2H2 zinc finger, related, related n=1 Tax=Eimeria acervulina TaxID=5801 RepID=U6GQ25_EIMAC|nr:U1 like C2H2 zinc finger, related, related [Eimeria acervulina]CDI82321.1 U1 like C2H2 zinc finger, related, related [Eimeria acervulina]